MLKNRLITLLIILAMLMPFNAYALGNNDSGSEWLPEDFTYGEGDLLQNFTLCPATAAADKLEGKINVITGFSASGTLKLKNNKDLVIPSVDTEGNVVQGIGTSAFTNKGLTSVTFPEGIMTDNNGRWDESVNERGDFFIGSTAFSSNNLTDLTLPEGVIYIGPTAFKNNKLKHVSFPSTLMLISYQSFASNELESLDFTTKTVFPLQIDRLSFNVNKLTEINLPDETEKVTKQAFLQNVGMEPVTTGDAIEMNGGIVYFHIKNPGAYIDDITRGTCNVQKLIITESDDPDPGEDGIPEDVDKWLSTDFEYKEFSKLMYGCDYSRQLYVTGQIISGFSEVGLKKLNAGNTDLVIPSKTPSGEMITGVGSEAFKGKGLTSVKFPTGMLVPYDDKVTQNVTRRGNFIIHEGAFANNELTEVYLPAGVLACLPNAFKDNKITTVTLPRTIWWIETLAFANNEISRVNFPQTCDFRLEMHGMTFAGNNIKSVRIPDYTEVINKEVFAMNPGMEPMTEEIAKKRSATDWQKYMPGGEAESGIVYMYTDREVLFDAQRIHTLDRPTKNQWSPFQKLVLISDDTPDADTEKWNTSDFTYDGTVVTGLSESGKEKRKTNKKLDIPDRTPDGRFVTEIAAADNTAGGLFGEEVRDGNGELLGIEGFEVVTLPNGLQKVGDKAFQQVGLREVVFPNQIKTIGVAAFQHNELEDVILPDSVTSIGGGAFASNPALKSISLPHNDSYTVVEEGAFGCSDMKNWMTNLTSIEIPDTITEIKDNAFAGNNFETIEIPESVTTIGRFAFSTKNYLQTPTTLILHEGLETIGSSAFRNKKIENVVLPTTLTSLPENTFKKVDTDWEGDGHAVNNPLITRVFVTTEEQYSDKENFPDSEWHKIYLGDPKKWTSEDFEYAETQIEGVGAVNTITGFSEHGLVKAEINTNITLPRTDIDGNNIEAIAPYAFSALKDDASSDSCLYGTEIKLDTLTIRDNSIKYIGEGAFAGNQLAQMEFPEGINSIGKSAFAANKLNKVTMPASISIVTQNAFSDNNISTLIFTEDGTSTLEIGPESFSNNKLKSLQLPDNLDKLSGTAFEGNPGMDNDQGVVRLYKLSDSGTSLEYKGNGASECQDIVFGTIPPELAPWGERHFTFSSDGTAITGFSEDGIEKLKADPHIELPGKSSDGTVVTTVEERAFYDYGGNNGVPADGKNPPLKGVSFAPSIKTIKMGAFQMCAIEDLVLPNTIKTIESASFSSNYGMKSVVLSDSIKEIPDGAFSTNATTMDMSTGIDKLVVPDGVSSIGEQAFAGQHIKKLQLPDTLVSIGANAFRNHQIRELEIPSSVRTIGERAFEVWQEGAAPMPEKLILHDGLTEIGSQAFGQTGLESVKIPSTLTVLAEDAFFDEMGKSTADGRLVYLRTSNRAQAEGAESDNGTDYSGIAVVGKNPKTGEEGGHRFIYDKMVGTGWNYDDFEYSDDGTVLLGWSDKGWDKRKDYADISKYPSYPTMVMPDKATFDSDTFITEIADDAFALELYNETTGEGEVTMQKFDCDSPFGIQRMVLPENLEKIGERAFEYNNLKAVDLASAKSLNSIGKSAFHGNHLVTVTIPNTVNELEGGAFAMNNIIFLTLSENVTKIPQGCFSMNIFMYEIEIPDTVTEIGEEAFAGARLEELEIPGSVTKIGKKAFHLHHLTSLHIPGNVKVIEDSAFEGTFKESTLKKLTFGEGIESIGRYAFKEALIEEAELPYSLKNMGVDPFYSNKGKDGSGVVVLYSKNKDHLKFNNDEYHGKDNGVTKHYHNVIYRDGKAEEERKAAEALEKEWNGTVSGSVPAAKSVKAKAAKKKIKVSWKKNTKKKLKKYDRVEIQVCPDRNFQRINTKRVEVKKSKKSATIKGLKKKTTYYVRVRDVKGTGTSKLVSKWSKVKKAKVK